MLDKDIPNGLQEAAASGGTPATRLGIAIGASGWPMD
jgi:hypothetical protein